MPSVPEQQVEMAIAAAKKAGADEADAIAIHRRDLSAGIRHGVPETIEQAESRGVGLRVFVGQASATLSSSDITREALQQLAEKAVAIARIAPEDPFAALADTAMLAKKVEALDVDATTPTMKELQALAQAAEEAGRSKTGITNSEGADASAGFSDIALATSRGFLGSYAHSRYGLSASFIAGSDDAMQRDYDYASATHLADLPSPVTLGEAAAKRTLERLHPRKLSSREAPVYFEPRVGRSLLAAFAGAISGNAIARGTSFLKEALEQPVFGCEIRITDDPLRARGLASRPFDGEGVRTAAHDFVQDGVLTSWILDIRTANQLGMRTTGHAARGLSSAPSPSATNLYLHSGKRAPEELMRALGNGFYVTETIGHGANLITGDFSVGASGFWMESGARAYPVSEVTIAGNLRDMFATLVPANDLAFRYGFNVPTLAVPHLTIAGD